MKKKGKTKRCLSPHTIKVVTTASGVEAWSYCDGKSHDVHVQIVGVDHIRLRIPAHPRHRGTAAGRGKQ